MEPCAGGGPLARNSRWRDAKHLRRVFDRKACEEPEFHDARLLLIKRSQTFQGVVEHEDIEIDRLGGGLDAFIDRDLARAPAALCRLMAASMFDQDLTHHTGCDSEKMSPILPLRDIVSDQPDIGFVNERRALKGVVGPFPLQVMAGDLPKFGVDQRN